MKKNEQILTNLEERKEELETQEGRAHLDALLTRVFAQESDPYLQQIKRKLIEDNLKWEAFMLEKGDYIKALETRKGIELFEALANSFEHLEAYVRDTTRRKEVAGKILKTAGEKEAEIYFNSGR